jgi:N6-adenosine-specific RNA methylase IME4
MSELVRMEGQLAIPGVFTATGLNLPDETTRDEWLEIGGFLARVHQTVAWWVGDWLNFGVEHGYIPRERYDEAALLWKRYERKTLRNFAWVTAEVESSRRRDDLSFGHHDAVAALPPAEQREWLGQAAKYEWSVSDLRRHVRHRSIPMSPLPEGRFHTIVADPPWEIERVLGWGETSHAAPLHYPVLSVEEIAALAVQERAADDAHLYLWTINAYVPDAYEIARAWGFEPSTLLVWCKPTHGLGLGGAYALTAEFVLFARRGTLPEKRRVDSSWFEWRRGRHSEKPAAFYELVESVSPDPYLELFAREKREGWTVWGNEVADAA